MDTEMVKAADKATLVVALIFPFTTIPQLYNIWVLQNASGVSVLTWGSYLILTIPLLLYTLAHHEKPLAIMYSLWLMVHASVVLGTLLYAY